MLTKRNTNLEETQAYFFLTFKMTIPMVMACEKYVTFHLNFIYITSVLVTHSSYTSFLAFIPENYHYQNL